MTKVFVDTSALLAILDEDDRVHDVAARTYAYLLDAADLVTHNYVLAEATELIRRRLGREHAIRLIDHHLPSIGTIWVEEATHAAALEAWRARSASISFVDEVSFLVMRRHAIQDALAFDRDFETAGFTLPRVPGEPPKRTNEQPAPYGSVGDATDDIVGVAEIARRSGRSISTVQSWRRRQATFPEPLARLAAGPVWSWSDVESWVLARRPGRRSTPSPDWDSPRLTEGIASQFDPERTQVRSARD